MCCAVLSLSIMSNSATHELQPVRLLCLWGFSRQEYWSGLPCRLPRDLPNPGIEPRSLTLKILYHLSHQRSPRILEWVAYPFSSRSSCPRSLNGVSCIAGGFLTSGATREDHALIGNVKLFSRVGIIIYIPLLDENSNFSTSLLALPVVRY